MPLEGVMDARPDEIVREFAAEMNVGNFLESVHELDRTERTGKVKLNLVYARRSPPAGWTKVDPREMENATDDLFELTEYFPVAWIVPKDDSMFAHKVYGRAALTCKKQL